MTAETNAVYIGHNVYNLKDDVLSGLSKTTINNLSTLTRNYMSVDIEYETLNLDGKKFIAKIEAFLEA